MKSFNKGIQTFKLNVGIFEDLGERLFVDISVNITRSSFCRGNVKQRHDTATHH